MILPDHKIEFWAKNGGVTPYDPAMINPASIDLRWSGNYRTPQSIDRIVSFWPKDKATNQDVWSNVYSSDHLVILPRQFVLLDTLEYIKIPDHLSGLLMLKSTTGRMGIEHHHAGFFDPGFEGTGTLEITNTSPWRIEIKRGQPLVQMVLYKMLGRPERDYSVTGRYVGQKEPQGALDER